MGETRTTRVLLVDDDDSFLRVYGKILQANGYETITANGGEKGLKFLAKDSFHLVITDIIMPGLNGMVFLKEIKKQYPEIPVIVLTGEGSIPGAVEAMRSGALTYLIKPVNIEELLLNVERALQLFNVCQENVRLKNQLAEMRGKTQFLGESPEIKEIKQKIDIVASSDTTVLITGESGTGKEIVCNLIHGKSSRADKPLIKVNCAALAESVLESELFGHEKGAFTGAVNAREGRFELADGGTLFLDEIGELSLNTQKKLLRVLQEKEFERVGGSKTKRTNFRLVVATNKDLVAEVKNGHFREDLFYRINVIPLYIPPLRQRREDIPLLLENFLQLFNWEMQKDISGFSSSALEVLCNYQWPGNVRELKNLVERLVVFARGKQIEVSDIPEEIKRLRQKKSIGHLTYQKAKQMFEEEYLREVLGKNGGNISATAKDVGLARKNLLIKLKKLGLR